MKKPMKLLFCLLSAVLFSTALFGCTPKEKPPVEDPEPELDVANSVSDDFNNVDYNFWGIMNTRWGANSHGGVIRENVGYTKEGYLVLTANGDYYNGEKKDVDGKIGKRTGAAIVSHKAFGPGVFSVRMKALPRFGATTAFWTYFNDGHTLNERGKVYNSEIDFELNVDAFDITMCTNWTAVEPGNYDNHKAPTPFYHNDGKWHEYTFKWMTDPERVDYYVDGIKIHSSYSNVPVYAAQVNLGVWFAGFAGTPDFETDYCLVDWFKYTPYKDQPYEPTPDKQAPSNNNGYPTEPMVLPEKVNLVGDAGFEYPVNDDLTLNAWYVYPGDEDEARTLADLKVEGAGRDGSTGMVLESYDRIIQNFTQVYPGYVMDFSAYFKHSSSQSGKIVLQYMPATEEILGSEEIAINASTPGFTENEFYQFNTRITIPNELNGKKVTRLRLRFLADDKEGNQITIDDIFMNHVPEAE